MTKKYLLAVVMAAMLVLAGCTGSGGYTKVGDAKVKFSTDTVTLDKGQTERITFSVSNDSDVEYVTFNDINDPEGIETNVDGKKVEPGETTTLTITSHENVEMIPIVVMCGKVPCTIMVPHYDGHAVQIGVVTSGGATETFNVTVEA